MARVVSRDRAIQSEEFKYLFQEGNYTVEQFDDRTKVLWGRLQGTVRILRRGSGVTFDQLLGENGMSKSEARQCIRILINLGGEVEIRRNSGMSEDIYILHN